VLTVRYLGIKDYQSTWLDMQRFTEERTAQTADELWVVEHYPVYTLGLNGKREHLLSMSDIPVINTDRGGQVTYHGPGQLVVYTLLDIKRLEFSVRALVTLLEQTVIKTLADYGIQSEAKHDAPGVYVQGQKIASIGLRIKKNCSYHGLSLNNQMDLSPFEHINPCGYSGLKITQLSDLGVNVSFNELANVVTQTLTQALSK
jgi:lipoyl(octanoyl) transferase